MRSSAHSRRPFLIGAGMWGAALLGSPALLVRPAAAVVVAPTKTMRGGSNNYVAKAPLVENLGSGFLVSGTVRKAGLGEPLRNIRIQIWASTARGGEYDASNRGSVMTDSDGVFRLEMSQIVPNFGQPHAHLAYDDDSFETVFLRPVMGSSSDTTVQAHFVLAPV